MNRKKIFSVALIVLLLLCGCSKTENAGESYPDRQIEIIVPYTAGGACDLTTRAFAPAFEKNIGQTTVIVNKPGASGVIGFSYITSSKNDGYTLGLVPLPSVCINHVLGELAADPINGYELLGGVCTDPVALCVSIDSPFDSLGDLIGYAREHPEELTIAASGMKSMDTVICLELASIADAKFNIVDFVGGAESLTAIMGGHADVMGGTYGEMISYAKAGQIKILAVGEAGYDYPTFEEEGYPISLNRQVRCLLAPKGLREDIREKLVETAETTVNSEEFKEALVSMGIEPKYISPDGLTEYVETVTGVLDRFKE